MGTYGLKRQWLPFRLRRELMIICGYLIICWYRQIGQQRKRPWLLVSLAAYLYAVLSVSNGNEINEFCWSVVNMLALLVCVIIINFYSSCPSHRLSHCLDHLRGKTTMGSALDGAVIDNAQILAYLVHNMSRSQLYLGFGHFGWPPSFSVNVILVGFWLNCISSVEITLFLLADLLLQHRTLFQC